MRKPVAGKQGKSVAWAAVAASRQQHSPKKFSARLD